MPLPSRPEFRSDAAHRHWDQVRSASARCLVCFDFDGTVSPIVEDPSQAFIHAAAPDVLAALAPRVLALAVVTGRPCRQVLELGHLEELADRLDGVGGRIEVRGQYGAERWSSSDRRIESPEAPESLVDLRRGLPELLDRAGLAAAFVEDKGLAVAVHTRRLPEPDAAADVAQEALEPVARELGLVLEPGRRVVEVRAPGTDKGAAVRRLVEELEPEAVVFLGDDLGDVPAFDAVASLRRSGMQGLLVCSGSEEQAALVERSDVVVDGPDGVMELLGALARE